MNIKVQANIILVCHKCLEELVIPNKLFNPNCPAENTDWDVPSLIDYVTIDKGGWSVPEIKLIEVPTSSVESYCPNCRLKEDDGEVAESG